MPVLNFLHLTDLHFGLSGQKTLWPNTGDAFYDDLQRLRKRAGPWQVVFFTGDLVQQGREDEFDALNDWILDPLWKQFDQLGCNPILLTVPGNHDLVRPTMRDTATSALLKPDKFQAIAEDVFDDKRGSVHRKAIHTAFANYRRWWAGRVGSAGLQFGEGLMPGDFSVTLAIDSHRIGVVGLNTTFLQLAAGNYQGKLVLAQEQFHRACGGDGAAWAKRHDVCILMTHQGPNWLTPGSRAELEREINPPGRFAVHLFGHEHQLELESRERAGSKAWRTWQGSSLFGLEKMGDPPVLDRRHGYSVGRLDFWQGRGSLRLWPRKAVDNPGWRFIPDHEAVELDDGGATAPVLWPAPAAGRDLRRPADRSMWTLARAQEDLANQMKQLDRQDVVEVHHIGLDMAQAHTRLVEMVREISTERYAVSDATLQLLVIGSSLKKFEGAVPASVRRMTKNVGPAVSNILGGLRALDEEYASTGKTLRIDVRSYHQRPTIHGFSLGTGGQAGPSNRHLSFLLPLETGRQ